MRAIKEANRVLAPHTALYLLYPAGQLIASTVFRADLEDGVPPWAFAGVMLVWLLAFAAAVRAQVSRRRIVPSPRPG